MFTICRSHLSKSTIIRVVLLLITVSLFVLLRVDAVQNVYADSDDEEITVYFTMNDENGYVVGNDPDHTVLARVPMKISYVDLAQYGMEDCYRYETETYMDGGIEKVKYKKDGAIVEKPTLLMLFLKALSKYYLGREITASDIAHGDTSSSTLSYTGAPYSFFMNMFWGHDCNLNYYVNHEYPLMWEGWGATADYILLEDGDSIEVQLIGMMPFYKFDAEEENMTQGDRFSPALIKTWVSWGTQLSDMTPHEAPVENAYLRYSLDYGNTWEYIDEPTDSNGQAECVLDTAGVYILSCSTWKDYDRYSYSLPTCIVHVTPEKIKDVRVGTGASGSIKCCVDKVKGADGYFVFYREQGASEWNKTKVSTSEFVLENAKQGTAYEFKASAYVTDRYVPEGEPYETLTGEESDVVSYTVSTDPAVIAAADALGAVPAESDVQLSDREVIEAARAAYDVLDNDQKKHIAPSDVSRLEAAETRLAELQAEKDAKDRADAAAVTNMITALPSAANVTYDDREHVMAAYNAYQALSPEAKAMVQSISVNKLNKVMEKINSWDADALMALIDELPAAGDATLSDKEQIAEAKALYDSMSDEGKALLPQRYTTKLNALTAKITELEEKEAEDRESAKAVEDMIKALPTADKLTLLDRDSVEKAKAAYDALNDDAKALVPVSAVEKLKGLLSRLAELEEEKKAQDLKDAKAVEDMIDALPSAASLKLSDRDRVKAAQEAYYALSNDAMALVPASAYEKLTALADKIGELEKKEAEDIASSAKVLEQIKELPDELSVQLGDRERVDAVKAAYDALNAEAKAMMPTSAVDKLSALLSRLDELEKQKEQDETKPDDPSGQGESDETKPDEPSGQGGSDETKPEEKHPSSGDEKQPEEEVKDPEQEAIEAAIAAAKKLKVKKLKARSKGKKITLTWKKAQGASGYQIQYKLKSEKKFKYLKKSVTKVKVKTGKLKKGKKYIFRVRPYRKVNGEKIYGKWTTLKAVKCK